MIKAILFDLDGTLLPMDLDVFLKDYLTRFTAAMAQAGRSPEAFTGAVWAATAAMAKNDGSCTNEEAFWASYRRIFGADAEKDREPMEDFYHGDFQNVRRVCGFEPRAAQAIREIKAMGYRVILATNPLFPAIATHSRIRWAGLVPEDFELITTFENSCSAKPNLQYYGGILSKLDLSAEECVMVGNDVDEDMVAGKLGMQVFLLTPCLINKSGKDLDTYPHGSINELMDYIRGL